MHSNVAKCKATHLGIKNAGYTHKMRDAIQRNHGPEEDVGHMVINQLNMSFGTIMVLIGLMQVLAV